MPSLPPKMKILSIKAKNYSKIEIEFSRSALFYTKTNTKICLIYFGQDCSTEKFALKFSTVIKLYKS